MNTRQNYYRISTLGCKANLFDSQLIERDLHAIGWKPIGQSPERQVDLCIVNSCTVTDEADRQSRKMASKLFRENPNARIVITGCAAEVDPERLKGAAGVHYVVGNRQKKNLIPWILEHWGQERPHGEALSPEGHEGYDRLSSNHPEKRIWPELVELNQAELWSEHQETATTRMFLKIQEGCNHFCTYCVIPYARGPARSYTVEEIVEKIQHATKLGVLEVVLTGTNLGDYGTDLESLEGTNGETPEGMGLVNLIKAILKQTDIAQIRLGSLDPIEVRPELVNLIETDRRLAPHIHLSVQACHTRILKQMKRKYSLQDVEGCLLRLSEVINPDGYRVYVGMDLIAGFPGEDEGDFEESFQFLQKVYWTRLHVFPYSEREGTPATRLPHPVRQEVRMLRSRRLNELSLKNQEDWTRVEMTRVSPWKRALFEKGSHIHTRMGYTPNYIRLQGNSSLAANELAMTVYPSGLTTNIQTRDIIVSVDALAF